VRSLANPYASGLTASLPTLRRFELGLLRLLELGPGIPDLDRRGLQRQERRAAGIERCLNVFAGVTGRSLASADLAVLAR
jgi:hypothetical protein